MADADFHGIFANKPDPEALAAFEERFGKPISIQQMLAAAVAASTWSTPGPEEEPVLTMQAWAIWECANEAGELSRHLWGWCPERYEGRCSTAVADFSPAARKVRTASGRVYVLDGGPGKDGDGEWVFSRFCARDRLTPVRDVSGEYAQQMEAATPPQSPLAEEGGVEDE